MTLRLLFIALACLCSLPGFAQEPPWRTAMITSSAWNNAIDFQTDAVLLGNFTQGYADRVRFYDMQGYVVYAYLPVDAGAALLPLLQQALPHGLNGLIVNHHAAEDLLAPLQSAAQAAGRPLEIITNKDYPALHTGTVPEDWPAFGRNWRNDLFRALAAEPQRIILFVNPEEYMANDDGGSAWKRRLDPAVAERMLTVAHAVAQALHAQPETQAASPADLPHDSVRRGPLRAIQNTNSTSQTQQLEYPAVDLLSPTLAITRSLSIPAGDIGFALDLPTTGPVALAGTARLRPAPHPKHPRNSVTAARRLMGQMRGPSGTQGRVRVLLPRAPGYTVFHWNPTEVLDKTTEWDPVTNTALFRFQNMGLRQFMEINW